MTFSGAGGGGRAVSIGSLELASLQFLSAWFGCGHDDDELIDEVVRIEMACMRSMRLSLNLHAEPCTRCLERCRQVWGEA